MRLNEVGKNRETDEEHDEDCVDEGFQLARVKFDRDGKEGGETLGMWYCGSNNWNEIELELDLSRKSNSYF